MRILTIGVHGFGEGEFFAALTGAGVDTFCDIRRRRGMRGASYAFANSRRLQERLARLGMRYVHVLELAPSRGLLDVQARADAREGVGKRSRGELDPAFVRAFEAEHLRDFDAARFVQGLGPDAKALALCCVERSPEACHRSLVARELQQALGLPVQHLVP